MSMARQVRSSAASGFPATMAGVYPKPITRPGNPAGFAGTLPPCSLCACEWGGDVFAPGEGSMSWGGDGMDRGERGMDWGSDGLDRGRGDPSWG